VKRLKTIILILVVVIAGVLVWQTVFTDKADDSGNTRQVSREKTKVDEPNDLGEQPEPQGGEPNEPVTADANDKTEDKEDANSAPESRFGRRGHRRRPGTDGMANDSDGDPNDPNDANEPEDPMEALNLKNVQMKDIISKIAEWTGKVIIPDEEVMNQKLTIYAPREIPRSQALALIYSALRAKGYVAEYADEAIYLKPLSQARLGSVPTISPEMPLASVENKEQVVQKFFSLENYSCSQMSQIILPLVSDYGYVSSDENTGNLLVIDTVKNLMRIERIVMQFDVPESDDMVTEIFRVNSGDPSEIVQLLRILLGQDEDSRRSRRSRRPPQRRASSSDAGKAVSVSLEAEEIDAVLIPEPRRNWIIAKASSQDMERITQWIERLDEKKEVKSDYETISIRYANVREVANRLNDALQDFPGAELKSSVLVQPLEQARQIMVFGRAEMRDMVKKLIAEVDVPTGQFETRVFKLKHADPEQVKENIDNLYGDQSPSSSSGYYYYYRSGQNQNDADTVKAIAFPTMKQVTVIASPENLEKIVGQIAEWDVPINVDEVKPRIIPLENSDPVQMANLLSTLFTEETGSSLSIWDQIYGTREDKKKIVGPLYGQLTFEPVPDTKKIIVISNIPEAYKVVEELVAELDSMEQAELPTVITLKYADAEDLCDQLNAILNEPGTMATLRRSERGLSEYTTDESGQTQSGAASSDNQNQGNNNNIITPWWNRSGSQSRVGEEMAISNLIGRVRFIPVPRSKAIMVLAPSEYREGIKDMVDELDQPGKQVMVKAIIIEVNHEKLTKVGMKLSSNPAAFGILENDALTALTEMRYFDTRGSFAIESGTNISALLNFLREKTEARILNQPTLWTKDNEEADFFKGRQVPFVSSTITSQEGTQTKDQVEYRRVGTILRVRPNITPEKAVNMTINLSVSEVEQQLVNNNIATSLLNTTTHVIVDDGQTIVLGGILFQIDSTVRQKVPLLGDLPLLGGIFTHNDTMLRNNELIVFITPYVVDEKSSKKTVKEIMEKHNKLEENRGKLEEALDPNELSEF